MNQIQFKIKLIELGFTQQQLAEKLGVTINTVNKHCNSDKVPLLYQWALKGLEFEHNKNKVG